MSDRVMSNSVLPERTWSTSTRSSRPAVTTGEIVFAVCWIAFVALLIALPWTRDAIGNAAAQVPPGMM